mgnify:CR=1 FL=1
MPYVPNSWGRTRRPKALTGSHVVPDFQTKDPTAGHKAFFVTDPLHFDNDLTSSVEGRNGYSTENQRFMHLMVKENSTANKSINLYGYNYAFGEWSPILLPLGNGIMTAVNCESGTASNEGQLFIIDLSGIDRVGFQQSGTDAPDRLRVAFTTF